MTDLETRLDRALREGDAADAKRGAAFARGASKQDYETPPELLDAVRYRFGDISWDLAATRATAKGDPGYFLGPGAEQANWTDALSPRLEWAELPSTYGVLWLNPPFSNIAPWAAKCASTRLYGSQRLVLLVPASIGANWFAEHVHGKAYVLALQGRLTFVGCDQPYPKDCVLAVYGAGLRGFDVWDWRS